MTEIIQPDFGKGPDHPRNQLSREIVAVSGANLVLNEVKLGGITRTERIELGAMSIALVHESEVIKGRSEDDPEHALALRRRDEILDGLSPEDRERARQRAEEFAENLELQEGGE